MDFSAGCTADCRRIIAVPVSYAHKQFPLSICKVPYQNEMKFNFDLELEYSK